MLDASPAPFSPTKHRVKGNITRAEIIDAKKGFAPSGNHAKLGIRFENKVAKALADVGPRNNTLIERNVWAKFEDESGVHFCAMDFVIHTSPKIIIETKLTYKLEAEIELEELYLPVANKLWGIKVMGAIIVRHMTPDVPRSILRLTDATLPGPSIPTLLYLGGQYLPW